MQELKQGSTNKEYTKKGGGERERERERERESGGINGNELLAAY